MDFRRILANLNAIPIFKMSLGSKELFHSNFMEYLWSIDKQKFIGLINNLFGYVVLNSSTTYELSREKENFDICIHHQDDNKNTIYDVIIENKVKSIPNKQQLDTYVVKGANHKQAKYLLLSLIENFPDKAKIEEEGIWTIVNYNHLHAAIDKSFPNDASKHSIYIQDYLEFIHLMQELQKEIIPTNFIDETLWPNYDDYKTYRLHDLYIKLRGLKFLAMLKNKLEDRGIASDIVSIGGDKLRVAHNQENSSNSLKVYLNWNVFNAVGQIAAFIYRGGNEIYEIVIQGNQYRHGINYYDENDTNLKSLIQRKHDQAIVEIWNIVRGDDFIHNYWWSRQPQSLIGTYKKGKPYCQYKPDYVYKYIDISKEKISTLMDGMVADIEHTLHSVKP